MSERVLRVSKVARIKPAPAAAGTATTTTSSSRNGSRRRVVTAEVPRNESGMVDLALLAHGAHFGPTLGVLGVVLALFMLPVLASTVLWYVTASGLQSFSVWVVCAPVVLVCLAALVFCAAVRFDMPLTLRVSTAVILICLSVFFVVVCIGAAGTQAMRAVLGWVSAAAPHWVIAGTVLVCGAVQLTVHGRCSDRCRCTRSCYGTLFCCGC